MLNIMHGTKIFVPHLLLLLSSFLVVGHAVAKTVYINDQLRVGIRPEPNNDSTPLTVVSTGDKLELLERDSGYALVRTKEDVQGWIKEIYITPDIPAIIQLKRLSKVNGGADSKIKELTRQVTLMESANQTLSDELDQAKSEKNKMKMQLLTIQTGQSSSGWIYWLAGTLIFAGASFVWGMYWYRNQAMKRLGGLRIYF